MFSELAPIREIRGQQGRSMDIKSRATQDRRNISRVIARLDCSFISGGVSHEAVIVDLSLKGAFLSSNFLPPNGSTITVEIKPPAVKMALSFNCTVLRGTWVMAEQGKRSRFGIRFTASHPDLLILISKLSR